MTFTSIVPPPAAGPLNVNRPCAAASPPATTPLYAVPVPVRRSSKSSLAKSSALPANRNDPRMRRLSLAGAVRRLRRVALSLRG